MAELALQMCRNLAKIFLYWPTHKTNPTDLQSETLSARVCMHVISIRIRKLLIWPAHASQWVSICSKNSAKTLVKTIFSASHGLGDFLKKKPSNNNLEKHITLGFLWNGYGTK